MLRGSGWVGTLAAGAAPAALAWAQGADSGPVPARIPDGATEGMGGAIVIGSAIALVVGVGVVTKLADARRRREDEVAALQGRLSDALMTDPMLSGLRLVATVRARAWRATPVTVVLTGTVPSGDLREAARRLVVSEVEPRGVSFELEDRVMVDPLMFERVA